MEKSIISEFNKIMIMTKEKTKMAKHKCFIYHLTIFEFCKLGQVVRILVCVICMW